MTTTIRPDDFFQIEDLLTSDERLIQETVRDFVGREVLPIIRDCVPPFQEQRQASRCLAATMPNSDATSAVRC